MPKSKPALSANALRALLRWYRKQKRELPWREQRDPYRIWISEILLQQTQVETVKPYYARFLRQFPTVETLAAAPMDRVLKAWEGCGYYARARNLHKAARLVAETGRLPHAAAEWRKLPGIGAYTAAAIASIAYGEAVPVIDGNVERVLARVLRERRILKTTPALKRLRVVAESLMTEITRLKLGPGDYNQALMELGATLCRPRSAMCEDCPLRTECRARASLADVTVLPRKTPAKRIPHYQIGAAVIRRRGKVLITQRPPEGMLGGLWEFPGGKQHDGESLEECVAREILEELGIEIAVGKHLMSVDHGYSHFSITLHCYDCRVRSGRIRKLAVADYRWVTPAELDDYAFPKADRVVLAKLKQT
ncbi:A/G-specific adenine glycosylase [candidate division KSB1 bacterium]|nr:A/G-specific adenine glycosylase [candidate division KSB1 bacterium]